MNLLLACFALIDSIEHKHANAVVLLEGDGYERIESACNIVNQGLTNQLIFSGGVDNPDFGSYNYEKCKPLIQTRIENRVEIIEELNSQNTFEQSENVIQIAAERNYNSLIIVASNYHIYRAYLTFLKTLIRNNLSQSIKIYPFSVKKLSWFENTPWGNRLTLLKSEIEKIELYSRLGHIADYNELTEYLQWMEKN